MFDGARFQKIYCEKNAENASFRRGKTDYYILQKLVLVTIDKALGNCKKRTTSETAESSRTLTESQINHDNATNMRTKKSPSKRIPNNFEEITSKNPRSTRREGRDYMRV